MRHSAIKGGRMKKEKVFCRAHYRRKVEHIPVIIPITIKYKLNGKEHIRKEYEYQLRCPVCWENEKWRKKNIKK
tara:strand:+ start:193 stop:414 length:222 start_codon:yes stop_codon:yes gene_type:complete